MTHHRRAYAFRALLIITCTCCLLGADASVARAPRAVAARIAQGELVRALFVDKGLPYPAPRLFIRAFKREGEVELWAGKSEQPFILIKTFKVCAKSGGLGPKRQRGDLQVPEGAYHIDRYNAYSSFHLSLGLSYPNDSDRKRKTARDAGGDIFIHGDCVTIGCLPLQDGPIEQLFLAALDTHLAGQRRIPVHIFPTRMDDDGMAYLQGLGSPHWDLWQELQPLYLAFEETQVVPRVRIDASGRYRLRGAARSRPATRPAATR